VRAAVDVAPGQLTPRQLEVLELVAAGYTSGAIARRLGIARATVLTHRDAIHRALGVQSAAHAVAVAISLGLVELEDDLGRR
jgi:DNA-binding CsgD family transcriptional regulator